MPSAMPTFGLWYDFRNPARWRQAPGRLYRETIDQAVWAEGLGFGSAWRSRSGEPVESGSARIQYLADHVIPQVNARLKNRLAPV